MKQKLESLIIILVVIIIGLAVAVVNRVNEIDRLETEIAQLEKEAKAWNSGKEIWEQDR